MNTGSQTHNHFTVRRVPLAVITFLAPLILSPQIFAIELTAAQWQSLQKKPLATSLMAMEKAGLDLETAEGILSASRMIDSFGTRAKLTGKQIHQLNRWRRSEAEIKVFSEQNPEELDVHIQIGPQAKAALKTIRDTTFANELYQKWQDDKFTQEDLVSLRGLNKKDVFVSFFNRLPPFLQTGFADWAMTQFNEGDFKGSGDFNYLLAHIAMITGDADIANFVIDELPVNEASFDLLKVVPEHFDESEQLELLKKSATKDKSRTLSFNLLAQKFAEDSSVAVLIAEALKDRKTYWQALTVLPAFVKVGNVQAFENVMKQLPESQQAQIKMRLERTE